MRNRTGHKRSNHLKYDRLRRPAVQGQTTTFVNLSDHTADRTSDGDAAPQSHVGALPSAGQDPLAEHMPKKDTEFYRTAWDGAEADTPLPDEANIRTALREQLIQQAGGNITASMQGVITSLVEVRVSLTKAYALIAKRGRFKLNPRTGTPTASKIFDYIKSLEDSQRLYTKLFEDQCAALQKNGGGRPAANDVTPEMEDIGWDGTPEGGLQAINTVNALLGLPEQTKEQVYEELKAADPAFYKKVVGGDE